MPLPSITWTLPDQFLDPEERVTRGQAMTIGTGLLGIQKAYRACSEFNSREYDKAFQTV